MTPGDRIRSTIPREPPRPPKVGPGGMFVESQDTVSKNSCTSAERPLWVQAVETLRLQEGLSRRGREASASGGLRGPTGATVHPQPPPHVARWDRLHLVNRGGGGALHVWFRSTSRSSALPSKRFATMEIADDGPFQTEPVRQNQGSHAHLALGEAAWQDARRPRLSNRRSEGQAQR